jgi:hypothetical protein
MAEVARGNVKHQIQTRENPWKRKTKERTKKRQHCHQEAYLEVPYITACFGNFIDHTRSCRGIKAEVTKVDHRHWPRVEVL